MEEKMKNIQKNLKNLEKESHDLTNVLKIQERDKNLPWKNEDFLVGFLSQAKLRDRLNLRIEKMQKELDKLSNSIMFEARSGSKWRLDELETFRIVHKKEDNFLDFFGMERADPNTFDEKLQELYESFGDIEPCGSLSILMQSAFKSNKAKDLLIKELVLKSVYLIIKQIDSKTDNDTFGYLLLSAIDIHCDKYFIEQNQTVKLTMNKNKTEANPDLILMKLDGTCLFPVQVRYNDFCNVEKDNIKAQLVAGLIAVYQENKLKETSIREYFGMILDGTLPRFFKMKITDDLEQAVSMGREPKTETELIEFDMDENAIDERAAITYKKDRLNIIQCFLALKEIIKEY